MNKHRSPQPTFPWLLLLACASSAGLMLPVIGGGPLALDECVSYWNIDPESPGSIMERSLNYAAVPPLFPWIQWAFVKLLGRGESVLRLPSILCAWGAVVVTYCLGRRSRNAGCGGLAALILAWHPEVLDEVRIARCYGMVLLTAALLLWATLSWWNAWDSYYRAGLWGAAAAGTLWTHYSSAFLVAVTGGFIGLSIVCRREARTSALLPWLLGMGIAGASCIPLMPAVLRLWEWAPFLNYMPHDQPFWHVVGPVWWLGLPIGIIVAWGLDRLSTPVDRTSAPARAPFHHAPTPWQHSAVLMSLCSLLPILLLACLAAFESMPSLANPRYRVAYAPAGVCLIALVLSAVGNQRAAVVGGAAALLAAWSLSPLCPWELGRLGHPADRDWRELNDYFATRSGEGEPIFVQSGLTESYLVPAYTEDRTFMEYVACPA